MAKVFEYIEQSEYEIHWQAHVSAYQSPNREQNLRFTYFADGFGVEPRYVEEGEAIPWRLTLRLESFGKQPAPGQRVSERMRHAQWTVAQRNAKVQGQGIGMDFTNSEEGMRQTFLVTERPPGDEMLALELRVQSDELEMVVDEAENSVLFVAPGADEAAAVYSSLKVWDAADRVLEAQMAVVDVHRFAILVDDASAVYPVTIDPLTSAGVRYIDQTSARFGYAVASSGNVKGVFDNGSGGGILVGAPAYDNGEVNEGRVFLFFSYYPTQTLASTPTWEAEVNQAYAHFGQSVAGYFDVDGDEYGDIMVGAPYYDSGNYYNNGAVFVWAGSSTGLPGFLDDPPRGTPNNVSWQLNGVAAGDAIGWSLAAADIRYSGYSDLIVGAPFVDDGNNDDVGAAYVFEGSSSGPSASPDWSKLGTYYSPYGSEFGRSVAAGDLSWDGYQDLAIGAPFAYLDGDWVGRVVVYLGGSSGLDDDPHVTMAGQTDFGYFGFSVATTPTLDDEFDYPCDALIVGAPYDDNGQTNEGLVYVYYGDETEMDDSPEWTAESGQSYAYFGYSVAGGKLDNVSGSPEYYGDVIVGAPYYDTAIYGNAGSAFVWLGSDAGLAGRDWCGFAWCRPEPSNGWLVFDLERNDYEEAFLGCESGLGPEPVGAGL